ASAFSSGDRQISIDVRGCHIGVAQRQIYRASYSAYLGLTVARPGNQSLNAGSRHRPVAVNHRDGRKRRYFDLNVSGELFVDLIAIRADGNAAARLIHHQMNSVGDFAGFIFAPASHAFHEGRLYARTPAADLYAAITIVDRNRHPRVEV